MFAARRDPHPPVISEKPDSRPRTTEAASPKGNEPPLLETARSWFPGSRLEIGAASALHRATGDVDTRARGTTREQAGARTIGAGADEGRATSQTEGSNRHQA